MKPYIFASLLIFSNSTYADGLNAQQTTEVQQIINLFQKNDVDAISKIIQYPLHRDNPIPTVNNATEMKSRFNQIFDVGFRQAIAQSELSQWDRVGSRGVMFDNGLVWINDNKIIAVNYSTAAEQQLKQQLIAKQKKQLHSTLKNFEQPALQFKTQKFMIRIDELANEKFRYAAWGAHQSQSEKPDLILTQGDIEFEGSGGNHYYTFKSGPYLYMVYRTILGHSESPEVELIVQKNGQDILNQGGELILP